MLFVYNSCFQMSSDGIANKNNKKMIPYLVNWKLYVVEYNFYATVKVAYNK